MRLLSITNCCLVLSSIFLSISVSAQKNSEDSIQYAKAVAATIRFYHSSLYPETGLYNGVEYIQYPQKIKEGQPFFQSNDYTTGSVIYYGILYENVPILYDLIQAVVVINDPSNGAKIHLHSENVSEFWLHGQHFVHLTQDSINHTELSAGFYDLLYGGINASLLRKDVKTVQETTSSAEGVENTIDSRTTYYLKKGGKYYDVYSQGSIVSILKDKKKEINQFIKQNNIDVRADRDNALASIVAYYDGLTR